MPDQSKQLVRRLLDQHGQTYADQAGIRLANKPEPLYQLLVLVGLLGARISAEVAVAAARELFRAGYRSPQAMLRASWQDRVDALGRGHYRRYDESTATLLGTMAQVCLDRWKGDLRGLREHAQGDTGRLTEMLVQFPRIGPVGADIFVREVQGLWTEFEPFFDAKVRSAASRLRLPATPAALAGLVPAAQVPQLAAALYRVGRHRQLPADLASVPPVGNGD